MCCESANSNDELACETSLLQVASYWLVSIDHLTPSSAHFSKWSIKHSKSLVVSSCSLCGDTKENRTASLQTPCGLQEADAVGEEPAVRKLGLPDEIDFRSFRTMHASLMRRMGGRLEVARDNMGHAGSTGSITLDVYSKSWWEERVDAVTRVVEAVFTEPEEKEDDKNGVNSRKHLRKRVAGEN
jgi:hypothetical protein